MITHEGWPLQLDLCPADEHLCEYLNNYRLHLLFHMGPGLHHMVGRQASKNDNLTMALTNSPEELSSYVDLVINDPKIASNYQVFFGDIYQLNQYFLPKFDIVSLFHLGEMPDERRKEYTNGDDLGCLQLFSLKLELQGKMIFYKGSSAFDRIEPIVNSLSWLQHVEDYKSLAVYKRCA